MSEITLEKFQTAASNAEGKMGTKPRFALLAQDDYDALLPLLPTGQPIPPEVDGVQLYPNECAEAGTITFRCENVQTF